MNETGLGNAMAQPDTTTRDDAWLTARMNLLWKMHFSDVAQGYPIVTRFGTRAQRRFGSISARNGVTLILINQLFADPFVPVYVIDGTLGHELAHYAHGFGSGLPRLYVDPHRGGVVDKELEKRGLGEVDRKADVWREAHWDAYYAAKCSDLVARKTARTDHKDTRWDRLLAHAHARTQTEIDERLCRLALRLGFKPGTAVPLEVEWLRATRRQSGTSYWYAKSRIVRLHGLLADRRVPAAVVDFELAYWLARLQVGGNWQAVHAALKAAGLEEITAEALRWRKTAWTSFCNRHHPLNAI